MENESYSIKTTQRCIVRRSGREQYSVMTFNLKFIDRNGACWVGGVGGFDDLFCMSSYIYFTKFFRKYFNFKDSEIASFFHVFPECICYFL